MSTKQSSKSMAIPSLSTTDITDAVVKAWKNRMSICLYGPPGCGKSQGVIAAMRKIGKELEMECRINPTDEEARGKFNTWLRTMATFTPEDVGGLPYTYKAEDGSTRTGMARTAFVPTEADAMGLFFLDEFGNAEEYKYGPIQSMMTERQIGEYKVPDGVSFVIATNRPEDNTGARELPSAIRNRCMQFNVVAPTGQDYIKLMRDINRKLHKYVEGFLLTFPSESYTFDPAKTASATLRSWEQFSKALESNKTLTEECEMLGALVGTEISHKYRAWRKLSEQVKLSEIIAKPQIIADYEYDKGLLYNIALGLLDHAEKSPKNIPDVFNVMLHMTHDEFSIYIIKNLLDIHNHNKIMEHINKADNRDAINAKLVEYKEYFV